MDDPYGSPDQKFDSEKSTKDDAALSHKIRGFPPFRKSGWARDCTYALGGAVSLSCRS